MENLLWPWQSFLLPEYFKLAHDDVDSAQCWVYLLCIHKYTLLKLVWCVCRFCKTTHYYHPLLIEQCMWSRTCLLERGWQAVWQNLKNISVLIKCQQTLYWCRKLNSDASSNRAAQCQRRLLGRCCKTCSTDKLNKGTTVPIPWIYFYHSFYQNWACI